MAMDLLGLSGSSPFLVSTGDLSSETRLAKDLLRTTPLLHSFPRRVGSYGSFSKGSFPFRGSAFTSSRISRLLPMIPQSSSSSSSEGDQQESKASEEDKVPFGYSRKDVLLIGLGVTVIGIGLKSGLEFFGVDPLQAGNVVQLVLVLGLTVGWISTYIFRVSNKEMTYAQQLRDYENKVMEKRLEGLTEAELEVLLQQVEEEKQQLARGEKAN
ncbi:hypothetical protein Scep_003129 [Stephania cephalantha]|uniref:Uncharacterized protein n=1 Tax=Stephania cephalantha TaxID=152367 RepID=A0AAP0KSJ3_9MAGN